MSDQGRNAFDAQAKKLPHPHDSDSWLTSASSHR